jgi:hypothetical protein
MEAKWKKMDSIENISFLQIESGPSIKDIYKQSKNLLVEKGLLIVSIDSPSLLNNKERKILCAQLQNLQISFEILDRFLWINSSSVDLLFEKSEFGSSGDTCFFINRKPGYFGLIKIPKITGILRKRFPKKFQEIMKKNRDNDIIYITNDVPDLLIATENADFLRYIDRLIEVKL